MLREAFEASGGKDACQVRVVEIERDYWMGTEIGRLGGYGFRASEGQLLRATGPIKRATKWEQDSST